MLNRGDVVVVDWIYSDRTGSKLRPAVVIQPDRLNTLIADTVLMGDHGTGAFGGDGGGPGPRNRDAIGAYSRQLRRLQQLHDPGPGARGPADRGFVGAALQEIEQTLKATLDLP